MSLEVTIRTVLPADLPQLQRVFREASLSNVDDRDALLSQPQFLVFTGSGVAGGWTRVAMVDGRLVGFASIAGGESDSLELEDLFVDPNWRRRGIARRLVADLVQTAAAGGISTLMVSGHPHAKAFYLSVGFVEFGTVVTELGSAPGSARTSQQSTPQSLTKREPWSSASWEVVDALATSDYIVPQQQSPRSRGEHRAVCASRWVRMSPATHWARAINCEPSGK